MKNLLAKKLLFNYFNQLREGKVTIHDQNQVATFGQNNRAEAQMNILNAKFYPYCLWEGSIGFAKAYVNQWFQTPNLTQLLQVFNKNLHLIDRIDDSCLSYVKNIINKIQHQWRSNSLSKAKKNIQEHYDLSNDFFSCFLDSTRMYSAAFFKTSQETLFEASENKLKLIAEKIKLKASDHVLEIGTGWGGFAIFAAKNYHCKVTTTTISKAQYEYVKGLIQQEGLEQQITLLFEDYRQLKGKFDKLVSIEMIEAVGEEFFPSYFKQCQRLLKPEGLFLMQAILMKDQRFELAKKIVDFIKKEIFPGGCLPSLSVLLQTMEQCTSMSVLSVENFNPHYVKTLACWRDNFLTNKEQIKNLGFSERLIRKWLFYFAYCEAAFLEYNIFSTQILFAKEKFRDKHV